jgi:uncharacterized C2H2 Zn-finger protein
MWTWMVSLLMCRVKHQCMMHFLGEKVWECSRCGRLFRIPESLTRASGPFRREAREHTHENSTVQGDTHKTRKKEA